MTTTAMTMSRTQAIETARRMYAGEWKIAQIVRYLADRGHPVRWHTVKRWVDQDFYDRDVERRRITERARWRLMHPGSQWRVITDADKLERLRALRDDADLSLSAIARVIRLDFGDELSRDQIEHALTVGRYPDVMRGRRG